MIVELKKRYGKGFRFNTSYTLAKAENGAGTGNGGGAGFEGPFSGARLYNQFDVESYRQLSPTDQCHRLVNSGIYAQPAVPDRRRRVMEWLWRNVGPKPHEFPAHRAL